VAPDPLALGIPATGQAVVRNQSCRVLATNFQAIDHTRHRGQVTMKASWRTTILFTS
jgi:hypothetical protein